MLIGLRESQTTRARPFRHVYLCTYTSRDIERKEERERERERAKERKRGKELERERKGAFTKSDVDRKRL